MSEAARGRPPAVPPTGSGPDATHVRPSVARLPTWVNIVLVLTLLASCSAASTAGDAVDQLIGGAESGIGATDAEVRDLCRLLGAVATQQGIDLDATFAGVDADTACEGAARGLDVP